MIILKGIQADLLNLTIYKKGQIVREKCRTGMWNKIDMWVNEKVEQESEEDKLQRIFWSVRI